MKRLSAAVACVLVTLLAVAAQPARAEPNEPPVDIEELEVERDDLEAQYYFEEALPIAERVLALREAANPAEPAAIADALDKLASINVDLDRLDIAESQARRSLDIRRKALGPDHPDIAKSLEVVARAAGALGKRAETEQLYREALRVLAPLGDKRDSVRLNLFLADDLTVEGRYADAEPYIRAGIEMAARLVAAGKSSLDGQIAGGYLRVISRRHNVAGRCKEAGAVFRAAAGADWDHHEIDHEPIRPIGDNMDQWKNLRSMLDVASGQRERREYLRAMVTARSALAIAINLYGPCGASELPVRARTSIAEAYDGLGDFAAAEKQYLEVQDLIEQAQGAGSRAMRNFLHDLWEFYNRWRHPAGDAVYDRYRQLDAALTTEAQRIEDARLTRDLEEDKQHLRTTTLGQYEREMRDHVKNDEVYLASLLAQAESLHQDEGRLEEAEKFGRRILELREKTEDPTSSRLAIALSSLSRTLVRQGKKAEALELELRALTIDEATTDERDLALVLGRYQTAELQFEVGDIPGAYALSQRAVDADIAITKKNWSGDTLRLGESKRPVDTRAVYLLSHAKMGWRLAEAAPDKKSAISARLFEVAQWAAASKTSEALAQMGVRIAAGNPDLAKLVRERQNLRNRWPTVQSELASLLAVAPAQRNADAIAAQKREMAEIDAHVSRIDADLAAGFSGYAALVNSDPLSIADLQATPLPGKRPLLGDDEALIVFTVTGRMGLKEHEVLPEETLVWVVTRTEQRWIRAQLGKAALIDKVAAFRCGLDTASWKKERRRKCRDKFGLPDGQSVDFKRLPFDLKLAHELYRDLFGGIEDLVAGKHLLIVPSGALTQLPFQALVTKEPEAKLLSAVSDPANIAWLARFNAVTMLPSVASLKALRGHAAPPPRDRAPYVAFANPLLDGSEKSEEDQAAKTIAGLMTDCAFVGKVAHLLPKEDNLMGVEAADERAAGQIDLAELRRLKPVPRTGKLACDVAKAVGAKERDIFLGKQATETEIKAMSASGALAGYAVVNFATHGVVAGELVSAVEPGLVLNPPDMPSEADDGYLSASEVAKLDLNADWVILSACNTAAAGAGSAEALSGLAKAFFYAGARSILVSHWAVRETAAVELVAPAMAAAGAAANRNAGRAESIRQAMAALAESPDPEKAHPAYWAPFVVVGEGASAQ